MKDKRLCSPTWHFIFKLIFLHIWLMLGWAAFSSQQSLPASTQLAYTACMFSLFFLKVKWCEFFLAVDLQGTHFVGIAVWNNEVFHGSTNITLQAVARIIVESLNDLSDHGLPVPGVGDGLATCLNYQSMNPKMV